MEHAFRTLAPLLVLPTGVVLILLIASLVVRRRRLAILAASVLWAFSTPLVANGREPSSSGRAAGE